MKDVILQKTYDIIRRVISKEYPEEIELLDGTWKDVRELLSKWIGKESSQWPVTEWTDKPFLGLGFTSPEVLKSALRHMILLLPPVLIELYTLQIPDSTKVTEHILGVFDVYARRQSTPPPLVKYLRKELLNLFINIPEGLEDTAHCWQVLPGGKRTKLTIRQAQSLLLKGDGYYTLINTLNPTKPVIYIQGEPKREGPIITSVLISLLKQDGQVCSYRETIKSVWQKLPESLPRDIRSNYIERVQKSVETLLDHFPVLRQENMIPNSPGGGYKVQGELLHYCILEPFEPLM